MKGVYLTLYAFSLRIGSYWQTYSIVETSFILMMPLLMLRWHFFSDQPQVGAIPNNDEHQSLPTFVR